MSNKKEKRFKVTDVKFTGEIGLNSGDIYMVYTNYGKTKLEMARHLTDVFVYQMCSTCNSFEELQSLAYSTPTIWHIIFQQAKMAWSLRK